jgi:hypothetical protein
MSGVCGGGEVVEVEAKVPPLCPLKHSTAAPDSVVRRVSKKPDLASIHGKIQIVNSFPDFKVKYVNSFPGLP